MVFWIATTLGVPLVVTPVIRFFLGGDAIEVIETFPLPRPQALTRMSKEGRQIPKDLWESFNYKAPLFTFQTGFLLIYRLLVACLSSVR